VGKSNRAVLYFVEREGHCVSFFYFYAFKLRLMLQGKQTGT
jgi:hypothetical protein